ncbi:DUF6011 domain-containing protein [Micromonospora humidisoli]|uniref:Uncharacterized protein n=1 Tax=Micromonospora humidisoli TaxID=2807622 RepID=A0ABS2JAT8_9ACTN|nr:DUF6011 domain-containing protein [Micromonospora humidisoli]MBM7083627.1 hypothetical protein [Micromonospora humidisoli]
MTSTEPVLCRLCDRPLRTPVSRARRIGAGCWRNLRAELRAQRLPVALPGMSGRGGPTQTGPDLLDDQDQDQGVMP